MPKAIAEKPFLGKTAIVTGGNSGIGKAAALRFAIEGANVAIIGRDAITGEATVAEIKASGGHASFHMADVGKSSEVESAMRAILSTYDHVDMAFNNAGVSGSISEFDAVADQEFASVFQTNLFGIYHSMKLQIRHFLDRNIRGCIVNCASISGLVGVPYQSAYCASKHAVVGLTKSVALEYAQQGIRINAVCPGGVATPMLKKYLRLLTPEKRTALELPPIGRMANSNEIANMVAWLCSDEASYVIGPSYAVDGGFTVR